MRISVTTDGGVLKCVATGRSKAGVRAIVNAHLHPEHASVFRDIRRYTSYDVLSDGTVTTTYPARVAFFKFSMHVNKKVSRDSDGRTIIDFYTPRGLAKFRGKWILAQEIDGTRIDLEQTMEVPPWAMKMLPVASAFRSRIVRAFEDMDACELTRCSR